ncbi:gliding-associated protein 45, putative [Babesia bigemina]|uniref:Gliding-associated protein 45, putative n=1 Tax=Babesia bigemina TaxID=5866 RepID=A0A061D5D0_BABBI|nr:gliding-associated protein 45, putative [Babesia bigemina]CDR94174.1 gliding-associated protein 45, putative [Babesia bigemina]|eukprot:XP_012766360.1 gliding-associated protein 45, putative [Babesia bigemina]
MPLCCSKKAAQRQKEYEEEVRMRKQEEAARIEKEQREREDARKAEIERIMQEEKQAKLMQQYAEEEMAEQERLKQEQEALEAQRRAEQEGMMGDGMGGDMEDHEQYEDAQSMSKMASGVSRASMDATGAVQSEGPGNQDDSFEMQTYTPFDMTTVDQTARYVANKCGCALKPEHKPFECAICQGIDLSDAPLIA